MVACGLDAASSAEERTVTLFDLDGGEEHQQRERAMRADAAAAERFEAFWRAYPRKDAKIPAQRAFRSLAPDAALLDRMLDALAHQRVSPQWQEGKRWIPLAGTWLRGERWNDEEQPPTNSEHRAATHLRSQVGGCMHVPVCDTYRGCVALIVRAARAREAGE